MTDNVYKCPHCFEYFIINSKELNCKIIRHARFIHDFSQVDPHLTQEKCLELIESKLIYGCCKPVMIDNENNAVKCDYI